MNTNNSNQSSGMINQIEDLNNECHALQEMLYSFREKISPILLSEAPKKLSTEIVEGIPLNVSELKKSIFCVKELVCNMQRYVEFLHLNVDL